MNSFPRTLLTELRCPCCGSGLEIAVDLTVSDAGLQDGTLRCDCYEYPVVQGIPVLRQMSPVSSTANEAVECLRRSDSDSALRWLLSAGSGPGVPPPNQSLPSASSSVSLLRRLQQRLQATAAPAGECDILHLEGFEVILQASRPRGYANYLFHRFANPSFLGAIPLLIVLGDSYRASPRRRLLDLLCGIGHSSATVGALCPELQVVMADVDFVNLYIGRRFLRPESAAVCVDVELPLPFSDRSFDSVFCLDGLHYVRSKVALLREVDRIVSEDGAWLFAHMHNANGANINAGAPLAVQGYVRRFAFGQQRVLPETEVLRQFQVEGALDLTVQLPPNVLESSDALTLMGARKGHLWRRHPFIDEALCRRQDLIAFNPLYRFEKAADGLLGRAVWPSESLQRECSAAGKWFSETVQVPTRTVQDVVAAREGEPPTEDVRKLLRSFVLVSLPECYPRPQILLH